MMLAYDTERAGIVTGRVKDGRNALADAWARVCEVLNGMQLFHPSAELSDTIDEINVRIATYKNVVKQRNSARKSNKEAAGLPVAVEDE